MIPRAHSPKTVAAVLKQRGKKSYGLIGAELGLTRNQVAGIMWRDAWPLSKRTRSPNGLSGNKCGTGRGRSGKAAPKNLLASQ